MEKFSVLSFWCSLKKYSLVFIALIFLSSGHVFAQDATPIPPKLHDMYNLPGSSKELIVCGDQRRDEANSCPAELLSMYSQIGESCAGSYADFLKDPVKRHFWVEDPKITAQGKTDERARQFLDWTLNTSAIDNSPIITEVWRFTSMIAMFGVVLVAAIFGIGYIISQRTNYDFKISIWPTVIKIGTMLLYVVLSYALVFALIQLSEILMRFSLENLGGRDLFNIYFSNQAVGGRVGGSEKSYLEYFGCRDLNIRVQEGIDSQVFMLNLTNVSYYILGVMLLLRKILLWFLLFVSPILALLMPFIFIRNIGWIWIGVFFQWLFYGPLLALFLGAMAKIWSAGIPWAFDFSRINETTGYIYPTGIFLVYGGPAQVGGGQIGATNNANYVDTFAEYVIALIMIWAVTFFPWFLLRIFRDYCCDGIYAAKNILMAMYDHMRAPKPGGSPSSPTPKNGPTLKLEQDLPKQTENKLPISSLTELKTVKTQELTKSLNLSMNKMVDVARFETNKQQNQKSVSNLKLIANPVQAEKPADRQMFMNLRSELFSRAIKNDQKAQIILQATSTSSAEKTKIREMILKSLPQRISINQVVSKESNIPQEKLAEITKTFNKSLASNERAIQNIAKNTNTSVENVQSIIKSYGDNVTKPVDNLVSEIANETKTTSETVKNVLNKAQNITSQSQMLNSVAGRTKTDSKTIVRLIKEIQTFVPSKESQAEFKAPAAPPQKVVATISSQNTQVQQVSSPPEAPKTPEGLKKEDAQTIKDVMTTTAQNEQLVKTLATETKLKPQQIKSVITSYASNVEQSPKVIIDKVEQASGVAKEDVKNVIDNITETILQSEEVVANVAEQQNIAPAQVSEVMNKQLEVAKAPEEHIEKTIAIPQSISIEDYEEVKEMWSKQYEEGEVPVSDSIATREDWVNQEVVVITNTLNKILSGDTMLQQQGLDEVGFLLPIFLINSLKGEELIVYLKAKLEAAKMTEKILGRESKLREKIKQEAEEEDTQVFVETGKKEEEKVMQMDLDADKPKLGGIEDRVKAVQEKLDGLKQSE